MESLENKPSAAPPEPHELEAICRLWIAAAEAKDLRIAALEAECDQLRRRVVRLSRMTPRHRSVVRKSSTRVAHP